MLQDADEARAGIDLSDQDPVPGARGVSMVEVVPVLAEVQSNDVPVYLAFPEELRHSKRIEAFRDFVQSEIIEHRKALKAQLID
mgnify:CR=1 FL=1